MCQSSLCLLYEAAAFSDCENAFCFVFYFAFQHVFKTIVYIMGCQQHFAFHFRNGSESNLITVTVFITATALKICVLFLRLSQFDS